jgi:hypothetical protein
MAHPTSARDPTHPGHDVVGGQPRGFVDDQQSRDAGIGFLWTVIQRRPTNQSAFRVGASAPSDSSASLGFSRSPAS